MAQRFPRHLLIVPCLRLLPGLALLVLLLAACSQSQDTVQLPAQELYLEAQVQEDQGLYTDAIEKFKKMVAQNPGTLLGSYGYLRLAELYFKQEDWVQAETNYRLFLSANSNGPLTPYVLYRLLVVNDKKSYTGLFFPSRETDRDTDPDRQILLDYTRFYLLYPKSVFMPKITPIYHEARETLASHELKVADFYMRHDLFNAAAYRYLYVLRTYPDDPREEFVLRQLIKAYKRNQQPDLALEMQRIYDKHFGTAGGQEAAMASPGGQG